MIGNGKKLEKIPVWTEEPGGFIRLGIPGPKGKTLSVEEMALYINEVIDVLNGMRGFV